jgi:hypothetical protein
MFGMALHSIDTVVNSRIIESILDWKKGGSQALAFDRGGRMLGFQRIFLALRNRGYATGVCSRAAISS